jgi:hypothetical protein
MRLRLILMLWVLLGVGLAQTRAPETVRCTTREDHAFKRLITTCSDGSRAVTWDDEPFKGWRTEVIEPGTAEKEMNEKTARW